MSAIGGHIGPDSSFYRIVSGWVSIVYVGVLWMLFSLPLITAGPATLALFLAVRRLHDDSESPRVGTFLRDMRLGWWTGVSLGVVTASTGVILTSMVLWLAETNSRYWVLVVALPLGVLWAMTVVWVYPIAAAGRFATGRAIRVAYLHAVRRPISALASCTCVAGAVMAPWIAPRPVALLVCLSTVGGTAWLVSRLCDGRDRTGVPTQHHARTPAVCVQAALARPDLTCARSSDSC